MGPGSIDFPTDTLNDRVGPVVDLMPVVFFSLGPIVPTSNGTDTVITCKYFNIKVSEPFNH